MDIESVRRGEYGKRINIIADDKKSLIENISSKFITQLYTHAFIELTTIYTYLLKYKKHIKQIKGKQ